MKTRKDHLVELAAAALNGWLASYNGDDPHPCDATHPKYIDGLPDRIGRYSAEMARATLAAIDVSEPAQEAPASCSGCGRQRSHRDEACNHCIGSAPDTDPIRAKLVAERDAAFRRVSWWKDGDYTQVQSLHVDSIRGGATHPDVRVAAAYRAELALREYDERKAKEAKPVEAFPMPTASEAHASGWDAGFDAGVRSFADSPVTKAALELAAALERSTAAVSDAALNYYTAGKEQLAYRRAVRERDAGKAVQP